MKLTKTNMHFKSVYHKLVAVEIISEYVVNYPLYSIMSSERSGISTASIGVLLAIWQ